MNTNTITPNLRLQVVKHLASGKAPEVVATIVDLPRTTVVDIGSHHGYPDKDKLSWAADILAKKVDEENAAGVVTQGTAVPVVRAVPSTPPMSQSHPREALTQPDEIRVLLNTAKAHPAKRIQTAANKVFDDIVKLRQLITEDAEKNAERRKVAAEKAKARAEVDRLKRELAEAQAKLRGNAAPAVKAVDDGPSAKDIRTWAAEAGVECPSIGRVPGSVREAYVAAHPEAS